MEQELQLLELIFEMRNAIKENQISLMPFIIDNINNLIENLNSVDDNNIVIIKEMFTIDFLKKIILSTEIDSLKYACNNLKIFNEIEKELLNFKIELFSYYFKEENLIVKGTTKTLSQDFAIWLYENSTRLFELYQNDFNNKNEILSIIRIILNVTFSYNLIELESKLRAKLKEIQK